MMDMVKDKLISSDLQFGFKSNSSCSHAILALQAGVKHNVIMEVQPLFVH